MDNIFTFVGLKLDVMLKIFEAVEFMNSYLFELRYNGIFEFEIVGPHVDVELPPHCRRVLLCDPGLFGDAP